MRTVHLTSIAAILCAFSSTPCRASVPLVIHPSAPLLTTPQPGPAPQVGQKAKEKAAAAKKKAAAAAAAAKKKIAEAKKKAAEAAAAKLAELKAKAEFATTVAEAAKLQLQALKIVTDSEAKSIETFSSYSKWPMHGSTSSGLLDCIETELQNRLEALKERVSPLIEEMCKRLVTARPLYALNEGKDTLRIRDMSKEERLLILQHVLGQGQQNSLAQFIDAGPAPQRGTLAWRNWDTLRLLKEDLSREKSFAIGVGFGQKNKRAGKEVSIVLSDDMLSVEDLPWIGDHMPLTEQLKLVGTWAKSNADATKSRGYLTKSTSSSKYDLFEAGVSFGLLMGAYDDQGDPEVNVEGTVTIPVEGVPVSVGVELSFEVPDWLHRDCDEVVPGEMGLRLTGISILVNAAVPDDPTEMLKVSVSASVSKSDTYSFNGVLESLLVVMRKMDALAPDWSDTAFHLF